ncbi:hypothetical protein ABW19_dt0205047 [Dactylella cylindrospora]|nr:hypothetical protein ABW19_dt0205047 [Dactylella cylindrospora]
MSSILQSATYSLRTPRYALLIGVGQRSPLIGLTIRAPISTSISKLQSPFSPGGPSPISGWDSNTPTSPADPRPSYIPPPKTRSLPPRLGPTAGRSIAVRNGDVGNAFTMLRRVCTENSIAREAAQQRFYERPGLKKKRQKRERFRRRFKESFKRMVNTVLEMKRQGI